MELDTLESKWNSKYPLVIRSWRNNWERLSQYFKYPAEIRRIIYTTNTIEAVHRQFRKLTMTKDAFPNQDSLLILLYLGIQNAQKKWTMPIQNWSLSVSQLAIFFLKDDWTGNWVFKIEENEDKGMDIKIRSSKSKHLRRACVLCPFSALTFTSAH